MRAGWGGGVDDCRFDLPPRFAITERRMAGLAIAAWDAAGRGPVPGFADNSVHIADADGLAVVISVGAALAAAFGLAPGMILAECDGLPGELAAACDLITLDPAPVPFETHFARRGGILVRGVALPLFVDGRLTGDLQAVISWRELLDRAATSRLRRDMGAAFKVSAKISARIDPFATKTPG